MLFQSYQSTFTRVVEVETTWWARPIFNPTGQTGSILYSWPHPHISMWLFQIQMNQLVSYVLLLMKLR